MSCAGGMHVTMAAWALYSTRQQERKSPRMLHAWSRSSGADAARHAVHSCCMHVDNARRALTAGLRRGTAALGQVKRRCWAHFLLLNSDRATLFTNVLQMAPPRLLNSQKERHCDDIGTGAYSGSRVRVGLPVTVWPLAPGVVED